MHFPSSQSVLCWLSLKHFIKRSQLKIQHSKHLGFIMALSTRCCCCRYSIIQTLLVVLSLILRPHGLHGTRLLCPPTVSRGLLKFTSRVADRNHLILSRPLLLLPSIFPSIRIFSNELASRIRWPNVFPMNIQGWFILHTYSSYFLSKIMKDRKFVFDFHLLCHLPFSSQALYSVMCSQRLLL